MLAQALQMDDFVVRGAGLPALPDDANPFEGHLSQVLSPILCRIRRAIDPAFLLGAKGALIRAAASTVRSQNMILARDGASAVRSSSIDFICLLT